MANVFQVVFATPEGLRKHSRGGGVLCTRATLVISELSWPLVHATVADVLRKCEARTWDEAVTKLQRYFEWEYEDYR